MNVTGRKIMIVRAPKESDEKKGKRENLQPETQSSTPREPFSKVTF